MHNPKNLKTIWLFLQLISFTLAAQDSSKTPYFDEVKIGNQIWMQKNLDVVTFRNGDTIPQVFGNKEWEVAGFEEKPAWCYYNYDSTNGAQYGKLYNWYAVNDSRGLAPEGWQIPSLVEWDIFKYEIHNLNDVHASCDGCKVKQADGWDLLDKSLKKRFQKKNPNCSNITNSTGFSAMAGGYKYYRSFVKFGQCGRWWSSTETSFFNANSIEIDGHCSSWNYFEIEKPSKEFGLSVRCIKDIE